MFGGKLYSKKIPTTVRKPLLLFTGNECLLIKREMQSGNDSLAGNCHANVARYCEKSPDRRSVSGWILEDNKELVSKGIWTWSFHSVCLRDGNELVDITNNPLYEGKSVSKFWLDEHRQPDLISGTNYNNIVVFESQLAAVAIGNAVGAQLKAGEIYWATRDLTEYRRVSEHNGKYRLISKDYPINIREFEETLNVKIVDGKLKAADSKAIAPKNIKFDWSVS